MHLNLIKIIAILIYVWLDLVSCSAPFMHARERVWSKGLHFLVLKVGCRTNNDICGIVIIMCGPYIRVPTWPLICTRYKSGG